MEAEESEARASDAAALAVAEVAEAEEKRAAEALVAADAELALALAAADQESASLNANPQQGGHWVSRSDTRKSLTAQAVPKPLPAKPNDTGVEEDEQSELWSLASPALRHKLLKAQPGKQQFVPAAQGCEFQVFIRSLGKTRTLTVRSTDLPSDVVRKLRDKDGVAAAAIQFRSVWISPVTTLAEAGVQKDATLYACFRAKGGSSDEVAMEGLLDDVDDLPSLIPVAAAAAPAPAAAAAPLLQRHPADNPLPSMHDGDEGVDESLGTQPPIPVAGAAPVAAAGPASFACPAPDCSRCFSDDAPLRKHYNDLHASDRAEVAAANLPAANHQCSRCYTLQMRTASGMLRKHNSPLTKQTCEGEGSPGSGKKRKGGRGARDAQTFPAPPTDLPADRAVAQVNELAGWVPFKRYRKKAQWTRMLNAIFESVADAAAQPDSHTTGSSSNLELQNRGFRGMQSPWNVPDYLHPSDKQRKPAPRHAPDNVADVGNLSPLQLRVREACRLADAGDYSRAMRVLESLGLRDVDAESLKLVREIFDDDPENRDYPVPFADFIPPVPLTQTQPAPPSPQQSQADVPSPSPAADAPPVAAGGNVSWAEPSDESPYSRSNLGRFLQKKAHVASDFLGWNASSLLHLTQHLTAKAYAGFVDWLQLIHAGRVSNDALISELRRTRGHLLNKKGINQLRAIGVVSWWMQVPSSLFLRDRKEDVQRIVGTENVAVGVRGGSEALVRATQLYLEEHPSHVAFSGDVQAAFPSIYRVALREAAKALPGLSPNVELHLGGTNTFSVVDDKRAVHNINIHKGGNTGCAKLPFLFVVAVQKALKAVRERHKSVRIIGQMDDHTILGLLADCIAAYRDMKNVFLTELHLSMNGTKAFVTGGATFVATEAEKLQLAELDAEIVAGIRIGGAPIGSDEYVRGYLDERLGKLDAVATLLEGAAMGKEVDAPWQGLFALVKNCVATRFHFLARVLLPSHARPFAEQVNARLVLLALRVSGHWLAASEAADLHDDVSLRNRIILLPGSWGGLGIPRMPELAGFVGAAALIGPAVKGLVPETDFNADTRYRRELADAIQSLRGAIAAPPPYVPPDPDGGGDAQQEPDAANAEGSPPDDATLKKLSVDDIYIHSRRKVQAALTAKLAAAEAKAVHAELLKRGDKGRAAAARMADRWQRGASAWLHATRKDPHQRLKNAHFRVAVGTLLGINCFKEIHPTTQCPLCHTAIGHDVIEHCLRCKAAYTGDNNRRHQAMQQVLLYLLRLAGATVVNTPGVVSYTGATPTDPSHAGRQLDLGAHGLDDGAALAIDLCVSDCGTGTVSAKYKTAAKAVANGAAKKKKYFARFTGINPKELCCPSYGRSGSRNTDAVELQQRITKALAAAVPSVPYSVTASRVSKVISVALQRAVAFNALDYRFTKLAKGRVVGGGAGSGALAVQMLAAAVGGDWDEEVDGVGE